MLRRFSHHDAKPSSTPMVVRSLDIKKDPFRPKEDDEEILSPECSYLGAIGSLLYLAQCTRPDISFAVNCLARHSNAPTRRHWNGIKDIFRYLKGTTDMGLFYPYASSSGSSPIDTRNNATLVGYADAGYLSDPHKGRSQSGYVFTIGNTAISWRSCKQTLVATSTNHSELLALYEATRECVWLRAVIGHILVHVIWLMIPMNQLSYTKITLLLLTKRNMVTSKGITLNTSRRNCSLHMNNKRFKRLKCNISDQIRIMQTCSPSHCRSILSKNMSKLLDLGSFLSYLNDMYLAPSCV